MFGNVKKQTNKQQQNASGIYHLRVSDEEIIKLSWQKFLHLQPS